MKGEIFSFATIPLIDAVDITGSHTVNTNLDGVPYRSAAICSAFGNNKFLIGDS